LSTQAAGSNDFASRHCREDYDGLIGLLRSALRIPRDREQGFHGMVNAKSTAT